MKPRAFTLVEIVIGMAAGAAVTLALASLWAPVDNWMFTVSRRGGISEAQTALMRMVKEIRRVKTPNDILTMGAVDFRFTDIDDSAVEFRLQGTDLERNSDVLASNVQGLLFEYLDAGGAAAGAAANVRTVRVTIQIDAGETTVVMRSSARIRNES